MSAVLQAFEARLLGPFTYHSVPDAGAAGATVTAPFLGDTALTYALHYALHGHPIPIRFGTRGGQDYQDDYRHFKSVCTVGVPVGAIEYLAPEYVASSFMSEGFEQKNLSPMSSKHRRSKVENTPWRPWRQIQSLAPSRDGANQFSFVAVSETSLPSRFTARIGLGRGCLLDVRETRDQRSCAVNRHTIERVLGRSMDGVPYTSVTAPLAAFQIHRGVPAEVARDLLRPVGT